MRGQKVKQSRGRFRSLDFIHLLVFLTFVWPLTPHE